MVMWPVRNDGCVDLTELGRLLLVAVPVLVDVATAVVFLLLLKRLC